MQLSIWNGRSDDRDDGEVELGVPDQAEAKDLNRHVDRCAMRYRIFTSRLLRQGRAIGRVEFLVYLLIAFTLATSNPAHQLWNFLSSHT
jgi:hypothetical protein